MKKNVCVVWAGVLALSVSLVVGAEPSPEKSPATEKSEASETPAAADPDGGWPRLATSEAGSQILMYQPQIESWEDQRTILAWSAIEVLISGRTKSEIGVLKLEAKTSVAMEERLVKLENIHIKQVNFPTLDQTRTREVTTTVMNRFPKEGLVIALDRILAAVDKSAVRANGIAINQKPPPIFFAKRPAILVQFDGEPIVSPIKDSALKFIVNTNWDILFDPDLNLYYLRNEKTWFSSADITKGWEPVKKLPKSFDTLPKDSNWDEIRASIPPKSISKSSAPLIYLSKEPAELIVTTGKPKTEPVAKKSKLLWIKNTECDVFQMKKGPYYLLVSGRWFRADKLEGPWTFSTPDLPKEFLNIPRTHPRARVRSSIPGTDEAAEAVLLANLPQTLRVEIDNLQSPEVKYQGDPKFVEIKGTKVSYAANTVNDVLKVGDMYYLCFQGAWLQSRRPEGPWELAKSVPDEIYKIPADCPLHHVTYVKVESSDAESVTYVCNSGYSGVSVSFGVAMYGTGWYYPPYYYGGYYPTYYPYHHSYGSYAIYNSRTGAYGYGSTVSGPYGGLSHAATYNPNTGTYARGSAAWGPSGGKMQGHAYNPRTGTSLDTRQGRNAQGSWGTTKVQRGDNWAQRGHISTDQGSLSGVRTSEGSGVIRGKGEEGSGFVGKKGDDIYAGKDGNVYRKTEDGWQQHTQDGWSDVERGEPKASTRDKGSQTRDQLTRDAGARSQGNQRVQNSSANRGSYQSGSYNRGGSRGSGGGGRSYGGGGGRRR
ncbi:MAG: hypothetical protein KCHDKBKB_01347 [Elusimicrobia bacterium]|nr:hypothetical protein [Elusimicrobiota bacterium]